MPFSPTEPWNLDARMGITIKNGVWVCIEMPEQHPADAKLLRVLHDLVESFWPRKIGSVLQRERGSIPPGACRLHLVGCGGKPQCLDALMENNLCAFLVAGIQMKRPAGSVHDDTMCC